MDLETTLATISDHIPETLDKVISGASAYMPRELSDVIRHASSYIPRKLDFISVAEFMLYFIAASLILSVLGRIFLGKRSSLNHSLSSVMGILFIYAATVIIYTFKPWNLEILLSPLPFVTFSEDYLILLPITDSQFPALCTEILSLVILSFLVNLVDTYLPKGNNVISWYLMRFITIALSMMLHLLVCWAFETYLPDVLVKYAPTALLSSMGAGASGMFETAMVAILVAAMCALIREHGGFDALLYGIKKVFRGRKGGLLGMGLLVGAMDIATANNTVAIVMANPIAKEMAADYGISPRKSASILDTFSCIFQGVIPYGAQMLVAITAAADMGQSVTAFEIMPFLFYPMLLLVSSLLFIFVIPEKQTRFSQLNK